MAASDPFGLPPCLHLPIAADSLEAIAKFVGQVMEVKTDRKDADWVSALCVKSYDYGVPRHPLVKLWQRPDGDRMYKRLHPEYQVWVDVDYGGYRDAYKLFRQEFGMASLPAGFFLDHVQNREAIRLRGYTHRYLRLCPVSRCVNTSGGSDYGGEGMEKKYVKSLRKNPKRHQVPADLFRRKSIIYADPMDITKMLNLEPGLHTLPGVGKIGASLYPPPDKKN